MDTLVHLLLLMMTSNEKMMRRITSRDIRMKRMKFHSRNVQETAHFHVVFIIILPSVSHGTF